jgi:bifunctional UDP-N-acetylglucosamine pyrophosphorylase / glucosamine-1-phosphate N-acetyltransferase
MNMTFSQPDVGYSEAHIYAGAIIEPGAVIEAGATIYPFCFVGKDCTIRAGATLYPHTVVLHGSTVGEQSVVYSSHIEASTIGDRCHIGPFAHLRDNAVVKTDTKIGNFVEVKSSTIGSHSFVSHLAYVGNATVGNGCNLAAGCITANYNSITGEKHDTHIEDGASIGANSVLVAPVHIQRDGFVAAGTVITEDVPTGSLAIGRQKQRNILNWVEKQRKKPENPEKT